MYAIIAKSVTKLKNVLVFVAAVLLNHNIIHVSLTTHYSYVITMLVSYSIPNTWSAREASLNFENFKAALESTQKIMGLSVVCGRAPSISFSITGRGEGEKVEVVTQPYVRK